MNYQLVDAYSLYTYLKSSIQLSSTISMLYIGWDNIKLAVNTMQSILKHKEAKQ